MTNSDPVAWYDANAGHYADEMAGIPIVKRIVWPGTQTLLPELADKRVLDAGCGDGQYTRELAGQGADVVGIDASRELLDIAVERYGDEVEFREADLREPLDFLGNESVDVVVSQLALDHVEEWSPAFQEFERILSPGGCVVCSVSHPPTVYAKIEFGEDGEFGLDAPSYYETQRWSEGWGDPSGEGEEHVQKFRRPLEEQVTVAFDAGLCMDGLVEPAPTEAFERERPDAAKRWIRRPSTFICYRFRKPGESGEQSQASPHS